ncbi:MAG: ATP-dependent helicase, partial [Alphaproteobacteria bacterium]|nr:ATP-dependent helicase [Alphaproteobacteria bacterium]
ARAGAGGIALSFCDPTERGYLRDIERLIRRRLTVIGDAPAAAAPDAFSKAKKSGGKPGGKSWHKRGGPHKTADNSNTPPHRSRRRRRAA